MKLVLAFTALLASNAIATEIYRCTSASGKTVFSDGPCTADQKGAAMTITAPRHQQSADEATQAKKKLNDAATSMYMTRRQNELKAIIRDTETEISSLQHKMDIDLRVLKEKMGYAKNNLAGATYQQSLAMEMQATSSQYEIKIKDAQTRLQAARDELTKL